MIFVPERTQARPADGIARRPELRARAGVHPDQARRRSRDAASRRRRHRRRGDPRQQVAAAARARARRLSQRQTAACSSPPTSRRAASMWKACRTSSISSCRTFRKITCTASAGRRAPAPRARPSRSAATTSGPICAASKSSRRSPFRWSRCRRHCATAIAAAARTRSGGRQRARAREAAVSAKVPIAKAPTAKASRASAPRAKAPPAKAPLGRFARRRAGRPGALPARRSAATPRAMRRGRDLGSSSGSSLPAFLLGRGQSHGHAATSRRGAPQRRRTPAI